MRRSKREKEVIKYWESDSELEYESSESDSEKKLRKQTETGLISNDEKIYSDEEVYDLPIQQIKKESIIHSQEEIEAWTEEEDDDTIEQQSQRIENKKKRMKEELEAVNKVIAKEKELRFMPDQQDIQWENGPFAMQISGGKRNINSNVSKGTENRNETLRNYIPSARFLMR